MMLLTTDNCDKINRKETSLVLEHKNKNGTSDDFLVVAALELSSVDL